MPTLYPQAKKFLEMNPTYISTVVGIKFYEHPVYGDESPLIAITQCGKKKTTDFWESPTTDDVLNWIACQ